MVICYYPLSWLPTDSVDNTKLLYLQISSENLKLSFTHPASWIMYQYLNKVRC